MLVLLLVAVHLSWEASRLEEETRTLAEEVGLLRMQVHSLGIERVAATPTQRLDQAQAAPPA